MLVGTDRLDRPLTIGQMQGKFQPVLLPQVRLVVGLVLTASMPQDVGEGAWLLSLVRLCFQCESQQARDILSPSAQQMPAPQACAQAHLAS